MLAVAGIYQNGIVKLDSPVSSENPVRVIITFLEDVSPQPESKLSLSDFSFTQSRKIIENYNGSFTDTLIEERRSAI